MALGDERRQPAIGRRGLIAAACCCAGMRPTYAASALPDLRLGVLQFGTVQWVADVIRRHGLDTQNGFNLRQIVLANTDAGRISLMASASDVVVSDWPFVATQRAAGTQLCFFPFSSSSGGIMTARNSPINDLAQLRGRRLGVAGGPVDKSWLVVQAAGRAKYGIDLAAEAEISYGAPPLLGGKLRQGELDAVLTFWNFAAKLESVGFREAIPVSRCAVELGLTPRMSLVGFVFHEAWANANRAALAGFLAAVDAAERLLVQSDVEWQAVRPVMDASDDALFAILRDRFRAGVPHEDAAGQQQSASKLFAVLLATGGKRATGGLDALPPGIFWPTRDEAS